MIISDSDILFGDLAQIMPFKTTLVRAVVTGTTLMKVLERSVNNPYYPFLWGGFLQYSGKQHIIIRAPYVPLLSFQSKMGVTLFFTGMA